MLTILKCTAQVTLFYLLSLLINTSFTYFRIPIPGSLAGIILLFLLLQTKLIRLEWVESGANWLLAELLLFFVPSAVGMIQYQALLAANGIGIMLILIVSTATVMACAGLSAEYIKKRKEKKTTCYQSSVLP